MPNPANATLVSDIARNLLAELAPQEMPIFPAASRAYFADPAAALKQYRSRDSALGLVFLTPVVLQVLSEVFEFLTDVAKKAVEAGLAKEIPEILKGMIRKLHASESGSPSVLTQEQIALVHGKVLTSAKRLRLPPERARLLADAVTSRLVLPDH